MKSQASWLVALGLAVVLWLTPTAQADPVSMVLTGVGNATISNTTEGGVYVSPYSSNFGLVVCADFFIDSQLNKTWDANVTQSGGDLSLTREATLLGASSAQTLYNQAAFLLEGLMAAYSSNDRTLQRQYSFAIWGVFNSSVLGDILDPGVMLNATDRAAAIALRDFAVANYSNVVNSNLVIYTPVGLTAANAATRTPQEFLQIRTPEGSAVILWGINLMAVFGLIFFFRRRTAQGMA
jgi:hypothetical protein